MNSPSGKNTASAPAHANPSAAKPQSLPPHPPLPSPPLRHYLNSRTLLLSAFLLAILLSLPVARGPERPINYLSNLLRFLDRFFPPNLHVLPEVTLALLESIQMAVLATAAALLLSIPLSLAAAHTISPPWLVAPARLTLNLIRTIPGLIWALFTVAILGPTPLAGISALAIYSIGYLAKFFSDALEAVNLDSTLSLRAIGAHPIQAFQYGLWPHVQPLLYSYTLWMLEYNIRSASIIGYVGAGGIGLLLFNYQQYFHWDKFATALLCILALVSLLDFLSKSTRKSLPI